MTETGSHPDHSGACVVEQPSCGCRRRRTGRRVRRGWVRKALLALLAERPMYGYEMITELAERTGGSWRPSPGSVYPTLQTLEDEGLVTAQAENGKRLFTLSERGRELPQEPETALWMAFDSPAQEDAPSDRRLQEATGQLIGALDQVLLGGTVEQRAQAVALVEGARRAVYRLLAEE
jgi:DNA-binding PadR family transcriptional regulator